MRITALWAAGLLAACHASDQTSTTSTSSAALTRRIPASGPPSLVEYGAQSLPVADLLAELGTLYELRAEDALTPFAEATGPGGVTYTRLQQHYRGLPVVGHQV